MSILSDVGTDISKFAKFLVNVFNKTSAVVKVLQTVGPLTLSAILAVFYDLVKFFTNVVVPAGEDVAAANITGAVEQILSADTRTLIAQLVTDFKAMDAVVVADFKALGITK